MTQRFPAHFLLGMGNVLPFTRFTHAIAFHRLGQNNGGLSTVLGSCLERGVDLDGIMAAPVQAPDILVAHIRHHCG